MLVFEFIGSSGETGWIDFMIGKIIRENKLNQILDENPLIIESASVISKKEGSSSASVQYELSFDKRLQKEYRSCKPLVKIYTTMPGSLVDELRSLLKQKASIEKAVEKVLFLNQKLNSDKKRRELTALAKIFTMKTDGFHYLVVKC